MIEQVDIDTCRMLHELRYFGDIRAININGEILFVNGINRETNENIPKTSPPSLHDVSDWLRKERKMDIRIECYPKTAPVRMMTKESIWCYRIHDKRKKTCIVGKRCFGEYGGALDNAIAESLSILLDQQ